MSRRTPLSRILPPVGRPSDALARLGVLNNAARLDDHDTALADHDAALSATSLTLDEHDERLSDLEDRIEEIAERQSLR